MSEGPLKRKVLTEKTLKVPVINKEDFEKYLQSIGGLVSGYKTNADPILSAHFFCVGDGWFGIIKKLIEESIAAGWDKQICQSKEKFGGLRFYVNSTSEEVDEIILKYCKLSYETCEECGEPGKVRQGGWIRTLCDQHALE
jgi:hypothetical protein